MAHAIFTHFVPEDVIVKGNGTFKATEAELSPRPGVNSNRMSFSSFLEFLKTVGGRQWEVNEQVAPKTKDFLPALSVNGIFLLFPLTA